MPIDRPDSMMPSSPTDLSSRRDAILEAIGYAAASLVSSEEAANVLPAVLGRLGQAVQVCRVVLDEYRPGPDGETLAHPLSHWCAPGCPPPAPLPAGAPVPLRRLGLGAWLESLSHGDLAEGAPDGFPEPVAAMLRAWAVQSYLGVPIILEDRLIGLLALADCRRVRVWSPPAKDALRIYAGMIGSYLHRLESERALRSSEQRYRQLVESSSAYVWEADLEGRMIYCSDRIREVLGIDPKQLQGKAPFDFLPEEDRARSIAFYRDAAARGVGFKLDEYRAATASGGIAWLSTIALPVVDESGRVTGFRGTTADITDRKEAQSILGASEERYRGLVESQRHLIVRWTPDYRLTFANEAYFRIFGLDRLAVLGHSILDSAPLEEKERLRDLLRTLSEPPFHVAHEQLGSTTVGPRWLSWECYAIHDESGRIVEFQAMGRDITSERQVVEQLRRRDRILTAVNATAERLISTSDWETAISEELARLGEATGAARSRLWEARPGENGQRALVLRAEWSAPEFPPLPDPRLYGPHLFDSPEFRAWADADASESVVRLHVDRAPEPLRTLMREQGTRAFLAIPVRVDGEFWGCLVMSHGGDILPWSRPDEAAMQAAARILSALILRERTKTSLRESEEKYRTLVEGARQPIIMVSRDGVLRFANRFAVRELGVSPEQAVGHTIWDLFPREYAESHMAAIRRAIDQERPVVAVARSVTRGRLGWFEARIQPLQGTWHGQPAAMVIISDITERKETERRILEYQSRLRSLSFELTLTEQRERRRLASELHDRIGQTLAVARIKLGGAQRAGADPALDEVRTLLDQSIQDTRNLTFELSPPILHELGLEPALEWLLERFETRHGFRTSFRTDGVTIELPGDVLGLIFQSVQELLVNVMKHARARTIDISVSRADDALLVDVVDDGIGTTSSQAPRTGRVPGGFGLFSIRERIEGLGGSFSIDAQPGKGTRARLRVPLRPGTRVRHRKERR